MSVNDDNFLMQRIHVLRALAVLMPEGFKMLEIGVFGGDVPLNMRDIFSDLHATYLGIDINTKLVPTLPPCCRVEEADSALYMAAMPADEKYDLIYVDGCHDGDYPVIDTRHAIQHLAPGGAIVIHDMSASNFELAGTRRAFQLLLDDPRFFCRLFVWDDKCWVGSTAFGIDTDRAGVLRLFGQTTKGGLMR
jgi:predicted O-methyltransferase YrrM